VFSGWVPALPRWPKIRGGAALKKSLSSVDLIAPGEEL